MMVQDVTSPLVKHSGTVQFGTTTQEPRERIPSCSPIMRQWLAALGPLAAVTSSGMTAGYSAVMLPQIQHVNSTLPVTDEQASWIASTAVLSMAVGCVISAPLMDRYGRRLSQQLICLPFALGWLLLAGASTIYMLYAGRLLTGLCVGIVTPLSTVFIAEMSGPKSRGLLLAVVSSCVSLGILLVHLLGTILRWDHTAAICAVLPVICFMAIALVPDTPSWLLSRGHLRQAERAFRWFRGSEHKDMQEFHQILNKQKPQQIDKVSLSDVFDPTFLKPFAIMNLFFIVQQCSGVNTVTFYTVFILQQVGINMDEYFATLLIDSVRVIMSVVGCFMLKRYSRRSLAMLSGVGTAISLLGLAALLLISVALSWLPVAFLVSFVSFVSIGLVPLPWVMIGEVFPSTTRGLGNGLTCSFAFLVFFGVVKTGPALMSGLGAGGTFLTYGLVALIGTGLLYFCLPETRNRTLQDIEDGFRKRKENVDCEQVRTTDDLVKISESSVISQ